MLRGGVLIGVLVVLATAPRAAAPGGPDPFAFLTPAVSIDAEERARIDGGVPLVEIVPSRDGHLSLLAVIRLDVTVARFLAWSAQAERLQRGRYVPEIGRFSAPPRLADVGGLTFDARDVDDVRRCRPGRCALKLSAAEIERVQRAVQGPQWRVAAQRALREVTVRRAIDYLTTGDAGALPYHDSVRELAPADVFGTILGRLTFMPARFGCLSRFLRDFPRAADPDVVDWRLYWSKENLGAKPIVSITHYVASRYDDPRLPEAMVIAKQVFATHYKNGSMTVTALAGPPHARYLVYLHRSELDVLDGFFGGLTRRVIERRVRSEAPQVLRELKARLEGGDPPPAS